MIESLTTSVDSLLKIGPNSYTSIFVYAIAGLASALFPCYYPLIPVTAGFLRRRSAIGVSGAKADPLWLHPLLYWLGSIVLYLLFGIVAASSGQALSKLMQNGWVILFFGVVFLYLAMAMIDLVPLDFDRARSLVDKAAGSRGYLFTFLMGIAAGLAASACVSPALVAIMLFIAKQSADGGSVVFGTVLSIAYGAGLGLPLFLTGVFGAKLPSSGKWMNPIKYGFAVIIYVAAIYQIEKSLIVLGVKEEYADTMLIYFTFFALLIIFALPRLFKKRIDAGSVNLIRFSRLQAVAVFSLFTIFTLSVLSMRPPKMQGDQNLTGHFEKVGSVNFYRDPKEAFAEANRTNRPVFIDFYADWCANCKDFMRLIESDFELANGLNKAVPLKIYDTDPAFDRFADTYNELNVGLPFFLVLKADQSLIFKTTNYRDKSGMIQSIDSALVSE